MVGEVAYQGLSLFGGASSEVRRCKCSVVVKARASFLPEIYLSIYLRDCFIAEASSVPPTVRCPAHRC